MRIAIVSDAIYPYHKGGKERRLDESIKRLAAAGHDIHVYTMQWWVGPKDKQDHGVWLHAICKKYPLYHGKRRSIKEGVVFALSCFKLLGKKFDIADVDHIPYFPLFSMWFVCLLRRKPMLATWHEVWGRDYWKTYMGGLHGVLAFIVERASIRLPKQFIAVSPYTARRLKEEYGVAAERIIVSTNGTNIDLILQAPVADNNSDLIFVGRLLSHKNVHMLVQAVAELKQWNPNVRAIVVGKGPEADNLKHLARKLGVLRNVRFYEPFEKNEDLFGIMKASKVFVFPSEREGFGLIALEANACGLPVLTLDATGNATATLIEPGKNGDTFKDLDELVELLRHYLSQSLDPELPIKHASNYSWDNTVKPLLERYAA